MRSAFRQAIGWVLSFVMVAPSVLSCANFSSTEEGGFEHRVQATSYSSGYQAPPPLPSHQYTPPTFPPEYMANALGSHPYAELARDGNDPAGDIPFVSGVRDDGSYFYEVPIKVPAGINGMTPQLSIAYNSRNGAGPLGIGFQLGGLSKIERCRQVLAVEERVEPVRFVSGQTGDSYCLDGKKLMVTGGTQGQPGSSYRTEQADYAQIKLESAGTAGKFVVTTREGVKNTYTAFPPPRREAWWGDHTKDTDESGLLSVGFTWVLTSSRDPYGNEIGYEYWSGSDTDGAPTDAILDRVTYANGTRSIDFSYEANLPGGTRRCVSGVCVTERPLLRSIQVVVESDVGLDGVQWDYTLEYGESEHSLRPRLERLTWCGNEGECLPGTVFEWQSKNQSNEPAYRLMWRSEPLGIDRDYWPVLAFSDVNGDGRDDLFYTKRKEGLTSDGCGLSSVARQSAHLRLAQGFTYGGAESTFGDPIDVTDLHFRAQGTTNFGAKFTRFADVNADGAAEMFAFNAKLDLSAGRHGSFVTARWDVATSTLKPVQNSPWNLSTEKLTFSFADADGDGVTDTFFSQQAGSMSSTTSVLLSDRLGGVRQTAVLGENGCFSGAAVVDGDGDGRYIFGCEERGYYSYQGRENFERIPDELPLRLDANGDGLIDLAKIHPINGGVRVRTFINTGNGFRSEYVAFEGALAGGITVADEQQVVARDFNGDGRDDLLFLGEDDVWPGTPVDGIPLCFGSGEHRPPAILTSDGFDYVPWLGPNGSDLFVDSPLLDGPGIRPYPVATGIDHRFPVATGDVDGNGTPEILFLSWDEDREEFELRLFALTVATGTHDWEAEAIELSDDLLVRIESEIGQNVYTNVPERITYGTIARLDASDELELYEPGQGCQWPQRCVQSGLTVVKSYTGAASDHRVWNYHYKDARSDLGGRGFIGFQCVTRQEEESGEVVKTCYDNRTRMNKACPGWIYPYADRPDFVETRTPIDDELSKVRVVRQDYDYYAPRWMNQAVYTVELKTHTTRVFEGAPTSTDLVGAEKVHREADLWSTKTLDYTFDDNGYATQIHETVVARGETRKIDIFRNYTHRTGDPYMLGLMTREEVNAQRTGANTKKRVVERSYDTKGRVARETRQAFGGDDQRVVLDYEYDPVTGNPSTSTVTVAGLPSNKTRFAYDEDEVHLRKVTNQLGHVAYQGIHPALGTPIYTVDANGVDHHLKYDFLGRLRAIYTANSGEALFIDLSRGVRGNTQGTNVKVSKDGGFTASSEAFVDKRGRIVLAAEDREDGGKTKYAYEYDSRLEFLERSSLPGEWDVLGYPGWTEYERDLLGRVTKVIHPDGTTETWDYISPYETKHVDQVGRQSFTKRDVAGLTAEVIQKNGSYDDTTKYRYYPFGELREVEFDTGKKITYEVDELGRRTKTVDPDAGVEYAYYNALGLVRQSKKGGKPEDNFQLTYTTDYQFDVLGRTTKAKTSCLQGRDCQAEERRFTYDQGDFAAGSLVRAESVTDGVATTIKYDVRARPYSIQTFVNGETFNRDFGYGQGGYMTRVKYPAIPSQDRLHLDYEYDDMGLLSRVHDLDSPDIFWKVNARYRDGRPSETWQNLGTADVYQTFDYEDLTRRVTHADSVVDPTSGGPTVARRLDFDYFDDGALKRATEFRDFDPDGALPTSERDNQFTYDAVGRLDSWISKTRRWFYAYNGDGSLTSAEQRASAGQLLTLDNYSYGQVRNAGPHAATQVGNKVLSYDKSGRLTQRTGDNANLTVRYNDLDLPRETTHVDSQGRSVTTKYRYDAFGNRVVKTTPELQVISIGGLYERRVHTPVGLPPTVVHEQNIYAAGQLVARKVYNETTGARDKTFIHADHQGSASLVINTDGSVRERLEFDPWGRRLTTPVAPNPAALFDTGYTGHDHDDELGLINMKGRMYDPGLRQVLTPDPLASAATNSGIHPYAYVMNDPVNFFDPTGFAACDVGTCDVFGSFSADPGPGGHYGWAYTGSWDTQTHNVSDYDWRWIENSRNVPINASSAQLFGGGGATFHGALGLSVTAGSHDDSRVSGATQSSTFSAAQLNTAQTALGAVSMVPGVVGAVAGGIAAGYFAYQGDYGLAAISAAGAVASIVGLGGVVKGALGSGKLGQAFAAIGRYFGGGAKGINNPIPSTVARVIPGNVNPATLGRTGTTDVFVTAADDIAGLNSLQIAERLSIPFSNTYTVLRFATPGAGLASPVLRANPGFVGRGLTAGGAREFVLPNGPVPAGAVRTVVGP